MRGLITNACFFYMMGVSWMLRFTLCQPLIDYLVTSFFFKQL